MSIDTVDDLHAAEDHIGALRHAANEALDAWALLGQDGTLDFADPALAPTIAKMDALAGAAQDPFVRPSCDEAHDDGEECDDDCGGEHPWDAAEVAP